MWAAANCVELCVGDTSPASRETGPVVEFPGGCAGASSWWMGSGEGIRPGRSPGSAGCGCRPRAYSHKGFSRPLSGGMSTPDLSGTRWQAHPRAGFRPGKSVRAHRVNAAESGSGLCFSSHSPHSLPRKRLDRPRETRNSSPGLPSSEASVSNAASGGKEPGHTLVLHQERTFPPIRVYWKASEGAFGRQPGG